MYELAGEEARAKLQSGYYEKPKSKGVASASVPAANLVDMVKHFEAGGAPEGFFPQAYWDVSQWSIGYGTRSKAGETISREEAEKRLKSELGMHRARVEAVNAKYNLGLTENEADALTSFDFNTGRLEELVAGGRRSKAEIAAALPFYRNAGGQRLPGLEVRRAAEQAVFLNGYGGKRGKAAFQAPPVKPAPVLTDPSPIRVKL